MVKVASSILAADFEKLEDEIREAIDAGSDLIHVDVMDGVFVNNETLGVEMYEKARKTTNKAIDVHLMVASPEKWIEKFKNADIITFHAEAVDSKNADDIIKKLHDAGIKVGITLKPNTSIDVIIPYIDKVDLILIMTVEPGWGGQKLIENCLEKVKIIRSLNSEIDIEVDGGVNLETCDMVKAAGANIVVAGTAIFKAKNKKSVIEAMKK